jgi:nanoRNase/pAp phosphatase (c-di-AMP/oligoRNAs hydrolase)
MGAIEVRWNGGMVGSTSQMVVDVLATATARGMTVKAMAAAIEEDTGEAVKANTLERTVRTMYERAELEVVGTARPRSYALPRVAAE